MKHKFLIFEDRKFVDIGITVQKQYHKGALRISEWAHIVNASILPGDGIIDALSQCGTAEDFDYVGERGLLILAEMTSKGSLASGDYTKASIILAKKHDNFVIGFVATQALSDVAPQSTSSDTNEDFVIFTTGINRAVKGDPFGQQYQTPESAIQRGADFIIAGRGIYAAEDPIKMVSVYRSEGWSAYLARLA